MDRILGQDANCIDVGAHTGAILGEMVRRAPRGQHFAFEPLPCVMAELRARFPAHRFPGVHLYEIALTDERGPATFHHVVDNPYYSGLRRRRCPTENPEIEYLTVRGDRLDAIVPSGTPIRFIKIDVEGGEYGVLRGSENILRTWRPYVVFEFGIGGADWYGIGPDDVRRLLEACELNLSALDDWLAAKPPLTAAEFRDRFNRGIDYYFLAHP